MLQYTVGTSSTYVFDTGSLQYYPKPETQPCRKAVINDPNVVAAYKSNHGSKRGPGGV